jgi:hypothetical protein
VYACGCWGDFHTRPVPSLALVEFEEGIQDVTGMVLSDAYGFYPAPSLPSFVVMLPPGEVLED